MNAPAVKLVEPPELRKARYWWGVIESCAIIEQAAKKFLDPKKEGRTDGRAESDAER
jgi:hypothetical protein